MNGLLATGIAILLGHALGELARMVNLPRVSGYIVAGLILNPQVLGLVSPEFVDSMGTTTELALAILTFAIGGTLAIKPLRELGKKVALIALGEAQLSALLVTLGCMATLPFLLHESAGFVVTVVPLAVLLGSLASPTDPSATLAVVRQYRAKGMVTFSIMAAAAVDDALGILNYSFAIVVALVLVTHHLEGLSTILEPLGAIAGALAVGGLCGLGFHFAPKWIRGDNDGLRIALLVGLLGICYSVSVLLGFDQLLATMAMGITVVNLRQPSESPSAFHILAESVEPLIFIIFFTVSGMLLDFKILFAYLPVVLVFVLFRTIGKLSGAYLGARLGRASKNVQRYVGWGLLPQGGIVIGLALLVQQQTPLIPIGKVLLNVVIGATVIHELIGPLVAKLAIIKAGETQEGARNG